jgi:hypothetical protein
VRAPMSRPFALAIDRAIVSRVVAFEMSERR